MKAFYWFWTCLWVSLYMTTVVNSLGFTMPAIGAGFAGLYAGYEYFKGRFFDETCNTKWITPNISGLSADLDEHLYGQHLVKEMVLKAIRIHLRKQVVDKPLVMSFHGWTGGGKNFVSKIIADNIYKEGSKSKFVHWFISTVDFPHENKVDEYKDKLQQWLRGNASLCELSMFIFDEVDKMPAGVLDSLKPFVDYYEHIGGIDFRRSIFIFLSNTGGREITNRMLQFWTDGKNREDVTYNDLEELISKGAFNEKGGLFRTSMIDKNLVDFYVPFLPLERKHVRQCIEDEFRKRKIMPDKNLIDLIADEMPYFPEDTKLYSKVGCKRVASKVDYYL